MITKNRFIQGWSVCVGLMDAITGILLIVWPTVVCKLLLIPPPAPEAALFLSWMGVFILGVGVSYAWALGKTSATEVAKAIWGITGSIRVLVAAFVVAKVVGGHLISNWLVVGISDALVAAVQFWAIWSGWFSSGKETNERR